MQVLQTCALAASPPALFEIDLLRWLLLSVVFEVQRDVVGRVRVAGCHIRQELATAEVADAAAQVEVLVEFIPGVAIDFRAHMAAVIGLVGHDRAARGVVDRVQRRSRPNVQPLRRESESPVWLNGGSHAHRLNVLPAKEVGDAKAVVGCRVDCVEGSVRCVLRRIAVARWRSRTG